MKKNLSLFYIILTVIGLTSFFIIMQHEVTAAENPGQATLISPSGATFTTKPPYTWNAIPGAMWYYLWVNDSTGNKIKQWYTAAQAGCASGTGTCSASPGTALVLGAAQWWVQATNGFVYGPWSATMNFAVSLPSETFTMWINHLDFIPADSTVTTSFDLNPNLGTGLLIGSTTTGIDQSVEKGLQVSPGFLISGVRVCYELSSSSSFINNISLARLQNPPTGLSLLFNDTTDLTNKGPICVDSAALSTPIDPSLGALRLRFGVNFASDKDSIVVRAVGLHLALDPNGPMEHSHIYLTGQGVGHNNTQAITSEPIFP